MLIGSRSGASPDFLSRFGLNIPTLSPVDLGEGVPGAGDPAAAAAPGKKKGFLAGIGDFIKSDQGKAALLRSGAATLDGGLGAGIKAGAEYVDGQKAIAARQQQQDFENDLATRRTDIDELGQQQRNDLGWAGVDVNLRQLGETTRSNQAREKLTERGQNVDMRGQDVSRANNTDSNLTSRANNAADNATSRANNAATVGASIYGTNLDYLGRTGGGPAGIGSKGTQPYTETRVVTPGQPAQNNWFSADVPATGETTQITRIPLAPGAGAGGPPPSAAIDALKANPNLRGEFERKYGPGSASQFLGGR